MHITGTVLTVERSDGDFAPDNAPIDPATGEPKRQKYDNMLYNVLVDNTIVAVKVKTAQAGVLCAGWEQGAVVEFEGKLPKGVSLQVQPAVGAFSDEATLRSA